MAQSSKVLNQYKYNTIIGDIKTNFLKTDQPLRFLQSIIRNFQYTMAFLSLQSCLMKIDTLIDISFCEKDENKLRDFVKRFDHFTKEKYCI